MSGSISFSALDRIADTFQRSTTEVVSIFRQVSDIITQTIIAVIDTRSPQVTETLTNANHLTNEPTRTMRRTNSMKMFLEKSLVYIVPLLLLCLIVVIVKSLYSVIKENSSLFIFLLIFGALFIYCMKQAIQAQQTKQHQVEYESFKSQISTIAKNNNIIMEIQSPINFEAMKPEEDTLPRRYDKAKGMVERMLPFRECLSSSPPYNVSATRSHLTTLQDYLHSIPRMPYPSSPQPKEVVIGIGYARKSQWMVPPHLVDKYKADVEAYNQHMATAFPADAYNELAKAFNRFVEVLDEKL